jgi:prolyl-tRNA editing enzyme YbaK/EbsC (Cys-tRNA(Pro) deacylase)
VPPFGHSTQLRVFVDPDLLQYDEVWAAAGTWNDNFGAAPADIVRDAAFTVLAQASTRTARKLIDVEDVLVGEY